MGIAPLLNDARRFLQLNFELIKQQPLQMYDFAHVWTPEKSLVRGQYAAVLGHTPRVLYGLSQSWEPLLHVIRHASEVKSVAFSPDGGRLASGSDDIVRIWNTATGELEHELEGHTDKVRSVAFSHNGRFIVSGSRDRTVRIWDMAICDTRYILTGHTSKVRSIAISRNDQFVVSGSLDGTVRIWDTATGEILRQLKGHAEEVKSVAVSPNCQHIASGSHGEVWIWTKDGVIEHKLECRLTECNEVYDLAFSHDGRRILCNIDRTEWATMGHRVSQLPDTDDDPDITSIAYSPNDNEIVCGMQDGEVMIWNRDTDETHKLGRHTYDVKSVAISLDGSCIASGSSDWTVRIWDPRLRRTCAEQLDSRWLSAALSHDSQWIVTTSHGDIQLWRVTETVTKMNELIVESGVESLALSHDGTRVVIGYKDGSILVWNHLTNLKTECQMSGDSGTVACVAFSYDGSHVVSGSSYRIRIWDCHTESEVALYRHSSWVMCVAFSHNGGRVAFGSYGTVQIWNPSTGEIHRQPVSEGYVSSVAFSHDDSHVISGWRNGNRVWIWNVMTNTSTMLSGRIQLPDGTRVHSLSKGDFHIYDPDDQETTNGIPPYLLSISPDRNWIIGEQGEHICWIHPQYQAFTQVHISKSIVYLQVDSGMIILDLKRTQHAERVMPGI